MNDEERNKTTSWVVAIAIGLLVALLVGVVFGFVVAKPKIRRAFGLDGDRGMDGTKDVAVPRQAYIQFTVPGDGSTDVSDCRQYIGGLPGLGGILYARPALSESRGDTIQWHGAINSDVVTVTFADSGAAGPFADTTYASPNPSSAPTAAGQSDFSFTTLTIKRGATTYNCTNRQGMGVHVDQ